MMFAVGNLDGTTIVVNTTPTRRHLQVSHDCTRRRTT
jgi:hypothetical protein